MLQDASFGRWMIYPLYMLPTCCLRTYWHYTLRFCCLRPVSSMRLSSIRSSFTRFDVSQELIGMSSSLMSGRFGFFTSVIAFVIMLSHMSCTSNVVRLFAWPTSSVFSWYKNLQMAYLTSIDRFISMFATAKHGPHSQKKRAISGIYSKSTIQASSQLKANSKVLLIERFLPLIASLSPKDGVDVLDINNGIAMDFASAYLFGISRSTNWTQDAHVRQNLTSHFDLRRGYDWYIDEIPPVLHRLMGKFYLPLIPRVATQATNYVEKWLEEICRATDVYLSGDGEILGSNARSPGDEPVVYQQLKSGIEKLRSKDPAAGLEIVPQIMDPHMLQQLGTKTGMDLLSRIEMCSEMFSHIEAGFDTTAVSLTYLYWEISRGPSIQDRLREEVLQLQNPIIWPLQGSTQDFQLPDPKDIDALPYLHAVVMEALRLHAGAPGSEPRLSPQGGSTLGRFSNIPGGVCVSAMPFALHRNPEVFPEPETFDPDRWLTKDEEKLKEMNRWFWAFSSGSRMCIGSHFALQEMKLLTAAIYGNWRTEIADDEGIEMLDGYVTRPKANRLMLRFIHR